MYFRTAILVLLAIFIFAFGNGCQKSESRPAALPPTVLSPDTAASVHWVGKHHLDLEADAYFFSRVWSLPETTRLQSQTFDKLATGSWRMLLGDAMGAQVPAAVLRPLFDDLAQEETYLEIRATTNSQPSVVLAVHVSDRRAGIWETNLAIAAQILAGLPAVGDAAVHGWNIRRTNAPARINLSRVGEWTLISVGPEQNPLAEEITARIRHDRVPFVSSGTNLWLEAILNPARLADCFPISAGGEGWGEVGGCTNFNLTLTGDGANVITRAQLTFPTNVPVQLDPWQIPVNLIHEPLIAFSAARGIQPWLANWPVWRDLQIGAPPDQLFFWSLAGSPYQTYLAAPVADAPRQVSALTDHLLQKANPWLATNGYISFDHAADANGVVWGNLPDIKPFIKSAGDGGHGWLFAGLLPETNTAAIPPPEGMIQDVLRRTNLVYYGWEVTGPRLQPCLQLGQFIRQLTRRPPLPLDSASLNWLAVLVPRLGTSATIASLAAPGQITFVRRSTLGLTAPELQLLAGWLESPQFPSPSIP
jgi:hypothetical protein